ncbi:MAG: SIS domain-containing protein [Clostridia bacterium]|jgi:glucosamine--fructose-6-phosphate aminotransferase (isomerizing)
MVMMWDEISEQPVRLMKCYDSNKETIKKIVGEIKGKNISSVMIAARGTSDHAGMYAKYLIEYELGLPVALADSSIVTIYRRKMNLKNSLVIGISQSGAAQDVLEVLKDAENSGALTVSITNDEASPLAKGARYHLYCNAGPEKSVAATKTCSTEMFALANLISEWSGNEEMKKELLTVPENITKLFDKKDYIISRADRYRFMNECFVLARGINYPIAIEAALKFQETSYVKAQAYATSDFQHGPYAMIQKDTPVFVFAPNGPSLKDTTSMIEKLKNSEADIIVFSNNKEVLAMGNISYEIPQTSNDMISPFYNLVMAQLFACRLSLAKGLNPDSPRSLSKVTITR